MHPLPIVLAVLSAQPSGAPPSEITGAVSPLLPSLCRPDGAAADAGPVLRCAGLVGTDVFLRGGEEAREVALARPEGFLPAPPEGGRLGRSVSWRILGDRPVAAVLRYRFPTDSSAAPDILLVLKPARAGEAGCFVGAVEDTGGPSGPALGRAADFADRRAPLFRCGRDQPALVGAFSAAGRARVTAWLGPVKPDGG